MSVQHLKSPFIFHTSNQRGATCHQKVLSTPIVREKEMLTSWKSLVNNYVHLWSQSLGSEWKNEIAVADMNFLHRVAGG